MAEHHVHYTIDGQPFGYTVQGKLAAPQNRVLVSEDDDLTRQCSWRDQGYTVVQAWDAAFSARLHKAALALIGEAFTAACGRPLDVPLDQYHTALSDSEHLALVQRLKRSHLMADEVMPLYEMSTALGKVLGVPVTCYSAPIQRFGCSVRIIRPRRMENNPLHKDVWLDHLRHAVNLYIPLAGSNNRSSLPLIPASHYWNEADISRTEESASVGGVGYNVPSVVSSAHGLAMTRPDVKPHEFMVFSPYLVHGGAVNLNPDTTRISFEMRFWRA